MKPPLRHFAALCLVGLLPVTFLLSATRCRADGTTTNTESDVEAFKHMSLEQLMNQDVTSVSREPEPLSDAPSAIQVITHEDIERSGAENFPEALRLAGNLDVAQTSSSGWQISARGFNGAVSDKLLVLMDGRSLYTPLLEGVIWNVQDYLMEDIDRIEVISGPGGTLWGANAVNGVINITSKDARDTQGVYLETGGGSQYADFMGARYGGMLASNVYYRVYSDYFDQNGQVFTNGLGAGDSWSHGQGGFRIDDWAAAQNHVTFQGDIYYGGTDVPHDISGSDAGGNLLGRWTHTFSDDSDLSLQMYYDRTHLEAPFSGSLLKDNLDTYDVDFQDRFPLGQRDEVIWGLGYRFTHDAVVNTPTVAFLPTELDQNLFSGFLQDAIKLVDKVTLTLGSKVEHNDYTGFEYEPSGRLQWNFLDNQMVWGAVSRAIRAPARSDRDLYERLGAAGPYLLGGNDTFDSETLTAYELGYRARFGSRVSGSLSGFYNDYDHLRSLGATYPTILPLYFQNNLVAQTWGLELASDVEAFSWWRWHLSYDLLRESIHDRSGVNPFTADLNDAHNETADPQQQWQLRWSLDLPQNITLDPDVRWVDQIHVNNGAAVATVPGYFELDARLAWQASKHWEVAIVGQNLLHDHHVEYGYPGPTQEAIERSVYGKVSFMW